MVSIHALANYGRTRPYRRMYLGGTFDCLHRGHLALFAEARKIAIEVIVSLNTDSFAERYKRKPLMPLADRLSVVSNCKLVDQAIVNVGDEDSREAILLSKADAVGHGDDWEGPSLMAQMGLTDAWLTDHGVDLVIIPGTRVISTSELLASYEARAIVQHHEAASKW